MGASLHNPLAFWLASISVSCEATSPIMKFCSTYRGIREVRQKIDSSAKRDDTLAVKKGSLSRLGLMLSSVSLVAWRLDDENKVTSFVTCVFFGGIALLATSIFPCQCYLCPNFSCYGSSVSYDQCKEKRKKGSTYQSSYWYNISQMGLLISDLGSYRTLKFLMVILHCG